MCLVKYIVSFLFLFPFVTFSLTLQFWDPSKGNQVGDLFSLYLVGLYVVCSHICIKFSYCQSSQQELLQEYFVCVCVCVCVCSVTQLCLYNPQTVAHQAPLLIGFSRQEYWSGIPFLPLGIFPTQGWNPHLLCIPALAGGFFTTAPTQEYSYLLLILCQLTLGCNMKVQRQRL